MIVKFTIKLSLCIFECANQINKYMNKIRKNVKNIFTKVEWYDILIKVLKSI